MRISAILFGAFLCLAGALRADQILMQNGDRYAGKVTSMTADTIVLESDVLGKLTLPRNKVAGISLGASVVAPTASATPSGAVIGTNQATAPIPVSTNINNDIAAAVRKLGGNTNFIEEIRKQFLADAGPEANGKFDELAGGVMSGKFDLETIRTQAKDAADKIRELKRQGGDVGDAMDSYLAILDNFLRETAQTNHSSHPSLSPTTSFPPAQTNSSSGITIIRAP